MMAQTPHRGLLFATAEVGEVITDTDWHDWYNNEHIPLRTELNGFKSATRFVAADDKKPTWAALYDLESADVLQSGAYLGLAETRSQREQHILENVAYFERRVYKLNDAAPRAVSDSFTRYGNTEPGQAAILLAVSMDVAAEDEQDFHRWYDEEHIDMIQRIPGWLRSRRYILVDSGITSLNSASKEGYTPGPRFLALHDFTQENGLGGPEHDAARATPWRNAVMAKVLRYELRLWKVYKTF